ncbi:hypothetical protein B0E33_09905 [Roseibium algicola]|uniref:DDE superfamily endonuclease n=1 Tax=Roseibium algicola TaxID=2857014 RepID=A0ABM6I0K3_9HYPH|nr:hypothetical protein B0E33_09905 [Roseibium aggregatum]
MLVQDNLNAHNPASLCATFEPAKPKLITEKIERNHTPKHCPWRNMAEAELPILSRQCLRKRADSQKDLARDVCAWAEDATAKIASSTGSSQMKPMHEIQKTITISVTESED